MSCQILRQSEQRRSPTHIAPPGEKGASAGGTKGILAAVWFIASGDTANVGQKVLKGASSHSPNSQSQQAVVLGAPVKASFRND